MRPILLLVPALILGASTLEAQAQQGATFDWTGRLAAGRTLVVRDINGSIRVTAARGDEASVRAVKRAKKGDVTAVQVKVEQDGEGVTVCALWTRDPDETCSSTPKNRSGKWDRDDDVTVEFTVAVPAGVRFEGTTVNGSIDAEGLTAEATAVTVNGDIELATSSVASATTVNGSVRLKLGAASWDGELDARTVNGSVVVEMPPPGDLELVAGTLNGTVSTDYALTLQGKISPQKLRGTIGKGTRQLRLQSVNGDVALRRAG